MLFNPRLIHQPNSEPAIDAVHTAKIRAGTTWTEMEKSTTSHAPASAMGNAKMRAQDRGRYRACTDDAAPAD